MTDTRQQDKIKTALRTRAKKDKEQEADNHRRHIARHSGLLLDDLAALVNVLGMLSSLGTNLGRRSLSQNSTVSQLSTHWRAWLSPRDAP